MNLQNVYIQDIHYRRSHRQQIFTIINLLDS